MSTATKRRRHLTQTVVETQCRAVVRQRHLDSVHHTVAEIFVPKNAIGNDAVLEHER